MDPTFGGWSELFSVDPWERAPRGSKKGVQGVEAIQGNKESTGPALRALIPYDFSLAVCLACEGKSMQTTLDDHL